MKLVALVAVPPGVVTAILPLLRPLGTVALICVALLTVKLAATPLKVTLLAPVKLVPVRVTVAPTAAEAGAKEVTVGAGITVKLVAEVAVPPGVVTAIGPLVAPAGTVAAICVSVFTVNLALTPLKVTLLAPGKFAPVRVTVAPTPADVGEKLVSVGGVAGQPPFVVARMTLAPVAGS